MSWKEVNKNRKGKTLEELYGEKRAKEIRQKLSERTREKNSHWKGGTDCYYRRIARKTMEEHLDRKLTIDETVHHIDRDITNNIISNLRLFPSASEHHSFHALNDPNWNNRLFQRGHKYCGKIYGRDSNGRFINGSD